jgi:hypothetical protein
MSRHPRPTLILLALATACGGDGTGPSGPPSVAGNWQYSLNVSNAPLATSCSSSGMLTVTQSGSQFSGNASGLTSCSGPGGQFTEQTAGPIGGGQISGSNVSFQFPLFEAGCTATGTFTGTPPNAMSGQASCTVAVSGQTVTLTGTWQASR